MRKISTEYTLGRRCLALVALILIMMATTAGKESSPALTIEITNRLHANYREVIETKMHEKEQIGDTDYFFEVVGFYPHFAIIDSTREVVSLSDELKNPAFKIKVYENEDVIEDTWAFFKIDIPHFARQSYLAFRVLEFHYGGEVHRREPKKEDQ